MVKLKEVVLISLVFIFALLSLSLYLNNGNLIVGYVTSESTTNLTWAGAAGLTLLDSSVCFGSGYYNASCTTRYSILDSNTTFYNSSYNPNNNPLCWINTTAMQTCTGTNSSGNDAITVVNSGSTGVNVSASTTQNAEQWLCGGSCPSTALARAELLSYNNASEKGSCISGLTSGYEVVSTFSSTATVGLCDNLDYVDVNDTINIFINASIPVDTTTGTKQLNLTIEALAL